MSSGTSSAGVIWSSVSGAAVLAEAVSVAADVDVEADALVDELVGADEEVSSAEAPLSSPEPQAEAARHNETAATASDVRRPFRAGRNIGSSSEATGDVTLRG
jgi:hypothetical protein